MLTFHMTPPDTLTGIEKLFALSETQLRMQLPPLLRETGLFTTEDDIWRAVDTVLDMRKHYRLETIE